MAAYLLYLADEQGNEELVSLNISKAQISSLLGTTPETLSRILTKMAGKRLIEVKRRDIKILNRKGLEELA